MPRFALTIEFDGTPFLGLQRQGRGPTVQASIERAVHEVTGERVTLHSAGRTDSGVHALGMVSHVDVTRPFTAFRLMEALNARLRPDPIALLGCRIVPEDWHARFSCVGRSYCYRIRNRRAPLTIDRGRAWHVSRPLDATAMHRAAQALVGRHDFTTFRSVHCQSKDPVKTLDRLAVQGTSDAGGDWVLIEAEARSFLHHQVRSMVGTLALVGLGQWPEERVAEALAARDRSALGLNAPASGLYLVAAKYPPAETQDEP